MVDAKRKAGRPAKLTSLEALGQAAECLKTLAHPHRLRIVQMLLGGYVHPSRNCEDVHPRIAPFSGSIPHERREMPQLRTIIKASFGFGVVNACVVYRMWTGEL